ncbi:hypothetical protein BDR06DRAFT_703883 [Suillus hirtellus]|nr:hypothetical protein BDR06DRAFT_703883 [Suillus hirtellus]
MGPVDAKKLSLSISKGQTGTSPTGTGSDFPQDSSSSNPEVAPDASSSIIAIPAVDEIFPPSKVKSISKYKSRSPRSESKSSAPQTTMRRKITQLPPRVPNPENYPLLPSSLPPPYSRSTSPHLLDSSRQFAGQAAYRARLMLRGATETSRLAASNASSATTLSPALLDSTPWPELPHLSPRLHVISEGGEEDESVSIELSVAFLHFLTEYQLATTLIPSSST